MDLESKRGNLVISHGVRFGEELLKCLTGLEIGAFRSAGDEVDLTARLASFVDGSIIALLLTALLLP